MLVKIVLSSICEVFARLSLPPGGGGVENPVSPSFSSYLIRGLTILHTF